jgi:hypothetical protein
VKIEKRQSERRSIERVVHMSTGLGPPLKCSMKDLSEFGARIEIGDPKASPQEFEIVLKLGLTRWCRVMWRSEDEIGIKFIPAPPSLNMIRRKAE